MKKKRDKLIYEELTYEINGAIFETHNELGPYCNEKQYCDKLEEKIKKQGLSYEREKVLPPSFEGEKAGRNQVDFVIENKVVIEAKAKRAIRREDYYQTQRYLKALNKKLAILVNFRNKRVHIKRVINPDASI